MRYSEYRIQRRRMQHLKASVYCTLRIGSSAMCSRRLTCTPLAKAASSVCRARSERVDCTRGDFEGESEPRDFRGAGVGTALGWGSATLAGAVECKATRPRGGATSALRRKASLLISLLIAAVAHLASKFSVLTPCWVNSTFFAATLERAPFEAMRSDVNFPSPTDGCSLESLTAEHILCADSIDSKL
jgi:hypothetical protein